MDDIMMLDKKVTRDGVNKMVRGDSAIVLPLVYEGQNYTVDAYRMKISAYSDETEASKERYSEYRMAGSKTKKPYAVYNTTDIWDYYFFLFNEKNTLVFWGFSREFFNDDDPIISGIGQKIMAEF